MSHLRTSSFAAHLDHRLIVFENKELGNAAAGRKRKRNVVDSVEDFDDARVLNVSTKICVRTIDWCHC